MTLQIRWSMHDAFRKRRVIKCVNVVQFPAACAFCKSLESRLHSSGGSTDLYVAYAESETGFEKKTPC